MSLDGGLFRQDQVTLLLRGSTAGCLIFLAVVGLVPRANSKWWIGVAVTLGFSFLLDQHRSATLGLSDSDLCCHFFSGGSAIYTTVADSLGGQCLFFQCDGEI